MEIKHMFIGFPANTYVPHVHFTSWQGFNQGTKDWKNQMIDVIKLGNT